MYKPFKKLLKNIAIIIGNYIAEKERPRKKEVVDIGIRLRHLRNKKEFTLSTVSVAVGFSARQLSLYETGKVEPNIEKLKKLAGFYGISLAFLLFGSNMHNKNLPKLSDKLTKKEFDVAFLIIQGYSNEEITTLLKISRYTLIDHINNIKRKVGSKDQSRVLFIRSLVDNYSIN